MNAKIKRAIVVVLSITAGIAVLAGCNENSGTAENKRQTDNQLDQYNKVQPIPFYESSQYRATLLAIQDAQAKGLVTTTFFFNQGSVDPIKSCESIGYPVPTTAQLTSPDQSIGNGVVISQMEPTGVYTGESTGTYVVCLKDDVPTVDYWEGFVQTEGGPARWDREQKVVVATGPSTVTVK
ncbi:hypothetical protein KC906_04065 [Candidatus Kaiserbacteria bacterium]|nr:hypothetical protein [Candidatus Kaiserbacteria bacterium]